MLTMVKTYVVLIAIVLLLEKGYDKKLPGRPLNTFTLCVLWTSAGQQKNKKQKKHKANESTDSKTQADDKIYQRCCCTMLIEQQTSPVTV